MIATTSELMTTGVDAKTCKLVVLDQHIQSMTKFKQIIGRGTRIDDRYGKLWFTILDFKKATELFADERFDGIPEKVLVTTPETLAETIAAEDDVENTAYPLPEDRSSAGSAAAISEDWNEVEHRVSKYYVAGVTVRKLAERVQYYDSDGKLVTESFKDYTRNTLKKQFASLDDFVKRWQDAERKQAVLTELADAGVLWDALAEDVGRDLDPFDLICHVVFDQPALTRRERAEQVKKRNYFVKYSAAAQVVLNALLDKYADVGVVELENIQVFKAPPFLQMGAPMEIVKTAFGSKRDYEQAVTELEIALYA